MNRTIETILQNNGIKISGICCFTDVASRLLETRNRTQLTNGMQSVIVMLFPYYTGEYHSRLSKYALVPDYHMVIKEYQDRVVVALKKAFPNNNFVPFADNSPIPEVFAAAKAGLGVIGQNGLLLNRRYGSFVFIGEIVTDLLLSPTGGELAYCEDCGLCYRACPAQSMEDKSRCLSEITQKKSDLSQEEKELIKQSGFIWGCDICQNICPYNHFIEKTDIKEFLTDIRPEYTKGDDLTGRAYAWRGRKVIERNCDIVE
ncbi:MAG: hypothetical protein BGN88_05200 [Clostridiales bacterium 43-6]|nr:MAG: hypothetical protein BGN88_05200 [Clostridiales bacterium 43-6]